MTAAEIKEIINAISAVGFPIVMCLLLFWQNYTQTRNYSINVTNLFTKIDNEILEITRLLLNDDLSEKNEKKEV